MKVRKFLLLSSLMLIIPIVGLLYGPLNRDNGDVHSLLTPLDKLIPFEKYFIIPYLAWYGLIFLILVWLMYKDIKVYLAALGAITTGLLICFGVYAVFQTTVPRPVISGQDIFSQLTKFIYRADNPYNAFPSIHVMTSFIVCLASNRLKQHSRFMHIFVQGMTVLIILSTLFLKQHTILDVTGGMLLGWLVLKISEILVNSFPLRRENAPYRKVPQTVGFSTVQKSTT